MNNEFLPLVMNVSKTTIAVIDGMAGRGAIKGEELFLSGQLREQCTQLVSMVEQEMKNAAMAEKPKSKK